jgi:hypothetical protein
MEKVIKVEHIWCEDDDRWIYIERYADTNFIGLNFCQGSDKEFFNDHFLKVDHGLSNFFEATTANYSSTCRHEISVINKCMWLYHAAVIAYEDVQTRELYLKRKDKEQN